MGAGYQTVVQGQRTAFTKSEVRMSSTFGKWGEDLGVEVACMGAGWGPGGVLERQAGQLRRDQRSSSFSSRQERILCGAGRGSPRTAERSFSGPRIEDGCKGGAPTAQGLVETAQRPQLRHCFRKTDPPMARPHTHAS